MAPNADAGIATVCAATVRGSGGRNPAGTEPECRQRGRSPNADTREESEISARESHLSPECRHSHGTVCEESEISARESQLSHIAVCAATRAVAGVTGAVEPSGT